MMISPHYELVDSHAHLDMKEFDQDRDDVIRRAADAGIRTILCPADLSEPQSLETVLDMIQKHNGISAAAGVHPHQAKKFGSADIQKIRELASSKKICALGEIGLDYYYNFAFPAEQLEAFRLQLAAAQELGLPVIIHCRNAGRDILSAVTEERFTAGGVLHCFTEDWDFAQKMMDQNFFVSFSGIVTFADAHSLREVASKIPLEKLLIETDSPYLVPAPHRGRIKRNEPRFVVETAEVLAQLKNVSLEDLACHTTRNFAALFMFEKMKVQC